MGMPIPNGGQNERGNARSNNPSRSSDVPFSRVRDKDSNGVTHGRMAVRDGALWGARIYPPYGDGTAPGQQTVSQSSDLIS